MLQLLYTFISLLLLLTDNMSDVVIVFQDLKSKLILQDTNLPSDTISMTTSLQIQPAEQPQTGAKTFSTRHKNNIIDFQFKDYLLSTREIKAKHLHKGQICGKQNLRLTGRHVGLYARLPSYCFSVSSGGEPTCRFTMESTSMVCLCNQIPPKELILPSFVSLFTILLTLFCISVMLTEANFSIS